jgi:hypothetical protein
LSALRARADAHPSFWLLTRQDGSCDCSLPPSISIKMPSVISNDTYEPAKNLCFEKIHELIKNVGQRQNKEASFMLKMKKITKYYNYYNISHFLRHLNWTAPTSLSTNKVVMAISLFFSLRHLLSV